MNNPLKQITKNEWKIWIGSLLAVIISNLLSSQIDELTFLAALIGVTSLIFAAKGNVWAQILMVLFSLLYGIISWRFRYWGEMITYLGMSMPMAVWSMITWLKNPSKENGKEVAIQKLNRNHMMALLLVSTIVTIVFYAVLKELKTPNLLFSTLSITTSFLAAALTMLRSSFYALAYAANDVVLVVLWILASYENPTYIPVVVNFAIFLMNDLYGFFCWKHREHMQDILP